MGNRFASDLQSRVNSGSPSISPQAAIQKALDYFQINTFAPLEIRERVSENHYIFENAGIALEPIPVKLVYEMLDDKSIRLAWNAKIYQLDAQNWWDVRIDAVNGENVGFSRSGHSLQL